MNTSHYNNNDDQQKDKQEKKESYALILLTVLIVFHVVHNILWIFLNNTPPSYDAAFHTVISLRFFDYLRTHLLSFNVFEFLTISNYYPPFVHWFGALLGLFSPFNARIIQFSGTVFLSLSLVFSYLLTDAIFKNKRIAILAAFFFSFFVMVAKEGRGHMLDIPLTAAILASLYFLITSHYFTNRRRTAAFFVSVVLGFLIKWVAPIFVLVPFLFTLYTALKKKEVRDRVHMHLLEGIVIVVLIASPWYVINLRQILHTAAVSKTANLDNPSVLTSLENIFFYPKLIINFQTHFVGFILFFISCILFIAKAKRKEWWVFIIIPIIFQYLFFTFGIENKNVRYLMPTMPFVAMIMAYGVEYAFKKGKLFLMGYASFVMVYMVAAYYILSFGLFVSPIYKKAVYFPFVRWMDVYYFHTDPVRLLYTNTDWDSPNKEIAGSLSKTCMRQNRFSRFFINVEKPYITGATINSALYNLLRGVPQTFQEVDTDFMRYTGGGEKFIEERELEDYLSMVDCAVIPQTTAGIGSRPGLRQFAVRSQINEYFLQGKAKGFEQVREIVEPDGEVLILFKRTSN